MSAPHRNSELGRTCSPRLCRTETWLAGRPQGIPNPHGIGYSQDRAAVVVEGATLATFVTGTIAMLIIGRTLGIGTSVVQRVVLETT